MPEFYCIKFGLLSAVFLLSAVVIIFVTWLEIKAISPKSQAFNKRESHQ
jgi:hypothetical protein